MLFLDNAAPDSCCAKRPLHIPTYPRLVSTAATVREKTWEQTEKSTNRPTDYAAHARARVNSNSASLSGTALLALSDDTASICLVRECRELEEVFGTHFTQEILSDNAPPPQGAIHERDRTKLTANCSENDRSGGEKDHLEQAVGQCTGPRRQIGEGPAVSQSCDEPPWLWEPPLPTL